MVEYRSNNASSGLHECSRIVLCGGVVAFPTDTVYGIGALYDRQEAVERIYSIKERTVEHALPVLIYHVDQLDEIVSSVPQMAKALIREFWPGALTIVMERSVKVPDIVTGGRTTVAVRIPDHPVALALLKEVGKPMCATSANISGRPPTVTTGQVKRTIGRRLDYILPGKVEKKIESTLVDVTGERARILRSGAIDNTLIFSTIMGGKV